MNKDERNTIGDDDRDEEAGNSPDQRSLGNDQGTVAEGATDGEVPSETSRAKHDVSEVQPDTSKAQSDTSKPGIETSSSSADELSNTINTTDQDGRFRPTGNGGVRTERDERGRTRSLGTDQLGSPGREGSMNSLDVSLDDMFEEDESNQGLFDDLLSGEPIFENKEVLRPSYTPHELPHRTEQINRMATILVSALRGDTPSNILIYGKTGTGKTASAKFVSGELEQTSRRYEVPCEVEYINCEVTDTQYRVLAQLANKFIEENERTIDERLDTLESIRTRASEDESVLFETKFTSLAQLDDRIEELEAEKAEMEPVPMTGWPTDQVYSEFFDAVDYLERVVVIMLDEIDKLVEKSGDDTLYNLSRMNSDLQNSRVSIMGISNDLKFTDFLDPRVKSSLGEEEIVFPPYDANQLRDILQHRADVAFEPGALTDDVIPLCAAFAAQEHGDARRALDLLRTAGELAERGGAGTVEESHVRNAQDKIELDRVVEVVRTLPTQSKIVLFSTILLEKHGVHSINTGEVYNIYKRLCTELDTDTLTQRRVTDLISELDMLGIVNAVVVSKGRYGRTKEISLSVPIEDTEAVLVSDSRLGDIEDAKPFVQARFDN